MALRAAAGTLEVAPTRIGVRAAGQEILIGDSTPPAGLRIEPCLLGVYERHNIGELLVGESERRHALLGAPAADEGPEAVAVAVGGHERRFGEAPSRGLAAQVEPATKTRERNFLPFIPWLSQQGAAVQTFPCRDHEEAIGINTPDDLHVIERYLSRRDGTAGPLATP